MVSKRCTKNFSIYEPVINKMRKSAALYTEFQSFFLMKDSTDKRRSVEIQVSEILDSLGSTEDVRSMTRELVTIADQYGVLESHNELGEAAGLVYIAGILTGNPRTLEVIAEHAAISPGTVRKYKTYLASELKTRKEWPGLPPRGQ